MAVRRTRHPVHRRLPTGLPALLAIAALSVAVAAPVQAEGARGEHCLALAMYWEAKAEGHDGMVAVGWVVKNRRDHAEFPDSLCAVVHEGGETPPCQFSWWCDGKSDTPTEADNWALARRVAALLLEDPPADPTGGALFFHSAAIEVPWAVARTRTVRVGDHIYYR